MEAALTTDPDSEDLLKLKNDLQVQFPRQSSRIVGCLNQSVYAICMQFSSDSVH